jgi:nucleolar protein 4
VSKPAKRTIVPSKPKSHDVNAVRTITITGLPNSVDSKAIWKKVRKQDGAESVVFPVPRDEGGPEDTTKAHVLFTTAVLAQKAVERLNAHIFKGSLLGVTLKKRLDKRPNGSSRLIVRNLPWHITESDLRALFLPYGAVYSVKIPFEPPTAEDEQRTRKPKAKGFAFVWMLTKADAEKALEGANGKIVNERPIAIDWALSKDKWEGAKEPVQVKDEDGSELPSDSDSPGEEDGADQSEGGLGVHSDEDTIMNSGDEGDEGDEGDLTKPELPPPEAGTTLFIRNVPWEASEDDMRQL